MPQPLQRAPNDFADGDKGAHHRENITAQAELCPPIGLKIHEEHASLLLHSWCTAVT